MSISLEPKKNVQYTRAHVKSQLYRHTSSSATDAEINERKQRGKNLQSSHWK
jgi:hypothetical protein